MYEFEILLEYHKGGQDATETSEGGNLKKKRVLIQNTKRIPSINFSFCEENTKKNWSNDVNKHFTRDIQKSINLGKNGKPFNSRGKWKWKPKIPPHIRTPKINDNPTVSENTEQWELSYTVHGNVNCYNHFGKLAVSTNTILGL